MTKPKTSRAPAETSTGATLIERVVRNYDLVRLDPAPIPQELVPPAAKRRRYRRAGSPAEPVAEVVSPTPAAPPSPPPPTPVPVPVAEEPQPEVVEPEVIAAPAGAGALAALEQPVRFTGPRHPVSPRHLRDQGLIVPEGSVSMLMEEMRIIKRQLLAQAAQLARAGLGPAAQRILICSPHSGEGKSFTAVNLALAIAAEKETEVLLVDADFAKPSVLSMLGLPGGPGLMDALVDPAIEVADCPIGTDIPGLWVLPAGSISSSDSEYLASSRTAAVLERLTQGAPHRVVIFDSPPALAASPAAELAQYAGQAVLVVRADRTGQGAIEDAVSLLSACPNIQLLLNAVHFSPSGRRFGSYYGYQG